MEAFQGRLLRTPAVRRPVVMAATSTIGLAILVVTATGLIGLVHTLQLVLTLMVPTFLVLAFYRAAIDRIESTEKDMAAQLATERATYRATNEYLASISHELTVHAEPCSLRAEALAVANEYREAARQIKVAVSDRVVNTDLYALRQVLHTLISNAVRHGGNRIAVWSSPADDHVLVTVSDDGPGVAQEDGNRLFERFVDLGASAIGAPGAGTGLAIAADLARLMGGEMSYRRDQRWTHFALSLPLETLSKNPQPTRVGLEAPVG